MDRTTATSRKRRGALVRATKIARGMGRGSERALQFALLSERMLRRGVSYASINIHVNTLADKYLPLEDL